MKKALLMCAAIMLGGCSEEKSTGDPKIDQALKDAVHFDSLAPRGGGRTFYQNNEPYSGWVKSMYYSGQVKALIQFKDGKRDGLGTEWHENGQKAAEEPYKYGKPEGLSTPYALWKSVSNAPVSGHTSHCRM